MRIKQVLFLLSFGLLIPQLAPAADLGESYRLHQGDKLQISVWGEETLTKEVIVLPDGSITFPLAGRVEVANLTTVEAEKRVTEKLKAYLPDPQVTMVISDVEGNHAYVIGKVLKPGSLPITGPLTVLQALSLAGGLDKFADLSSIQVLRANGKTVVPVNYSRLIRGQNLESNVLLNSGDTILVP